MFDAFTAPAAASAGFDTPENLPGIAAVLAGLHRLDDAGFELDADDLRNLRTLMHHLRTQELAPADVAADAARVPVALVDAYRAARDLIEAV